MTREELTDRVLELFPQLAEVEPWDWAETEEDEPVVMTERHATFTGLESGAVDLTTSIPNTSKVGVWRIEPSGHYVLTAALTRIAAMTPTIPQNSVVLKACFVSVVRRRMRPSRRRESVRTAPGFVAASMRFHSSFLSISRLGRAS